MRDQNNYIYKQLENQDVEIKTAEHITQEIREELIWHYKDLFINI